MKRAFGVLIAALLSSGAASAAFAPALDPSEAFPGSKEHSVSDTGLMAFSHPLKGVGRRQRLEFFVGNSFFQDNWVMAPASTTARDGLGPTFNAISCSSCHHRDGRGRPDGDGGRVHPSLLFRLSLVGADGSVMLDPIYGDQLQTDAVHGVRPEGEVNVIYNYLKESYSDGRSKELRRPNYDFTLNYGEFSGDLRISPRLAPQIIGLGFLEAVSAQSILEWADASDSNGDGISGRPNWIPSESSAQRRLGRFGWKANQVDLKTQNAAAFIGDLGITSSLFAEQNCMATQRDCLEAIAGGEPEIEDRHLDRVTLYTQLLAVPQQRPLETGVGLRGREVFYEVGCHQCHRPSYTTGDHEVRELASQKIWPYTDLLLHDMGEDLADHRPDFTATGREWRTPPLWGLGLVEEVNGALFLLHDGRARDIAEAILWHGGEAEPSREAFRRLSEQDRQALENFVLSL